MKAVFSKRFQRSFQEAPEPIKRTFHKQLACLLLNYRHPSLRTKKYDAARGIWQGRVTGGWRFYFTIADDTYYLIDLIPHPK